MPRQAYSNEAKMKKSLKKSCDSDSGRDRETTNRPAQELAGLQQQIGNRAVQRLVASPVKADLPARESDARGQLEAIQRYSGPEHQDFGDRALDELFDYLKTAPGKKWASKHGLNQSALVTQIGKDPMRMGKKIALRSGLKLSPGEIISLMGDYYETWENLQNAPKKEVQDLLKVMKDERYGKGENASARFEKITKGRYTRLAAKNVSHFAPANRERWLAMHKEAIQKAQKAGEDTAAMQEALLIDAAGGHYLTDAFAAGHLFEKNRVVASIETYLKSNPVRVGNPDMQFYVTAVQTSGKMSQLVVKLVHDQLNARGFLVRNKKGMEWKTFGDEFLKNAEATRHIGALAVFLSRQQIYRAQAGASPNPDKVLDLLPEQDTIERANNAAIALIPEAAKAVPELIFRERSFSRVQFGDTIGRWIEAHLSDLGFPGTARRIPEFAGLFKEAKPENFSIPDPSTGTGKLTLGPFRMEFQKYKPDLKKWNLTAPIPGLEGLSGEIDINGDDLMIGVHVDLGILLPSDWGFGPSLPKRIGSPE